MFMASSEFILALDNLLPFREGGNDVLRGTLCGFGLLPVVRLFVTDFVRPRQFSRLSLGDSRMLSMLN